MAPNRAMFFFFPRFGSALVWLPPGGFPTGVARFGLASLGVAQSPWSSGPLVLWFFGPLVLVLWSRGPVVLWSPWLRGSWLLGFGGFFASWLQWLRGPWLLGFSASVAPWLLRTQTTSFPGSLHESKARIQRAIFAEDLN